MHNQPLPLTPAVIHLGAELSRGRWAFAFALVTSLFFTWGFAYGVSDIFVSNLYHPFTCYDGQLLDVLNSHFQTVFGITKLQSTLLQLAYFVSLY